MSSLKKRNKNPSWKCLLETHLFFQLFLSFAHAMVRPSHYHRLSCQLWKSALKLICLREREFECVRYRKWGGSGSWPSPQYRGAIGPGGDGKELEGRGPIQRVGGISWPSCHVGMWAQCYQISLFSKRMWNPFVYFLSSDFISLRYCLKLKPPFGLIVYSSCKLYLLARVDLSWRFAISDSERLAQRHPVDMCKPYVWSKMS